jgi:hypothetical protein
MSQRPILLVLHRSMPVSPNIYHVIVTSQSRRPVTLPLNLNSLVVVWDTLGNVATDQINGPIR